MCVTDRVGAGSLLVGIDWASGTGKSTLGDDLAVMLTACGATVVRASMDSFHRPRADRYRRGQSSPEGYYLDSHNLEALTTELLEPFRSGSGWFRRGVFDEPSDTPTDLPPERVPDGGILMFDGLFLHRAEIRAFWDVSVFLMADQRREDAWRNHLTRDLTGDESERAVEVEHRRRQARRERYIEGQAMYEREAMPLECADVVIDNDDLRAPKVVVESPSSPMNPHVHDLPDSLVDVQDCVLTADSRAWPCFTPCP